jgi:hypothetical protein
LGTGISDTGSRFCRTASFQTHLGPPVATASRTGPTLPDQESISNLELLTQSSGGLLVGSVIMLVVVVVPALQTLFLGSGDEAQPTPQADEPDLAEV